MHLLFTLKKISAKLFFYPKKDQIILFSEFYFND
jgi:hypothetical protein